MRWQEQIEQELGKAAYGLQCGNDGLARVCSRRAVSVAMQQWMAQQDEEGPHGDVMHHLRLIQEQTRFPSPIREAAQRLLTKVTEQQRSPMTTDPIADARMILDHLKSHI